jgi:hypothetical protein
LATAFLEASHELEHSLQPSYQPQQNQHIEDNEDYQHKPDFEFHEKPLTLLFASASKRRAEKPKNKAIALFRLEAIAE